MLLPFHIYQNSFILYWKMEMLRDITNKKTGYAKHTFAQRIQRSERDV